MSIIPGKVQSVRIEPSGPAPDCVAKITADDVRAFWDSLGREPTAFTCKLDLNYAWVNPEIERILRELSEKQQQQNGG